jgi:hypothetical protein
MALSDIPYLPDVVNTMVDSSFIGRSREVEALRERLLSSDCRLLTLVGQGWDGQNTPETRLTG